LSFNLLILKVDGSAEDAAAFCSIRAKISLIQRFLVGCQPQRRMTYTLRAWFFLIWLAEAKMNQSVKLYRGDSTKISRFSMDHADKLSLYGPGIYLTTNKKVAEEYTRKGMPEILLTIKKHPKHEKLLSKHCTQSGVLWFDKNNAEKLIAYYKDQAEQSYLKHLWQVFEEKHTESFATFKQKHSKKARLAIESSSSMLLLQRSVRLNEPFFPYFKITNNSHFSQISTFEFDPEFIRSKILDISRPITDVRVLKILFDRAIQKNVIKTICPRVVSSTLAIRNDNDFSCTVPSKKYSRQNITFKMFCDAMRFIIPCGAYDRKLYKIKSDTENQSNNIQGKYLILPDSVFRFNCPILISKFKYLGYKGYKYGGGTISNSDVHHDAYSIWDEHCVNAARTQIENVGMKIFQC
jgi:hypothetical protein